MQCRIRPTTMKPEAVTMPHYSPHENTMDRKPLGEDDDKGRPSDGAGAYHHGSMSPPSLPVMPEDYYAHRPEHPSPPGGAWGHLPFMPHGQQFGGPPFYAAQPGMHPNQMPPNQMHHSAPAAYYHAPMIHPSNIHPQGPPMMPGPMGPNPISSSLGSMGSVSASYLNQHGLQRQPGPPPPSASHPPATYQALDSRGSLSSFSSADDTLNSSARRRHNRRQRRSGGGSGSRHGAGGGGNSGGSPPNRGWYRYDDSSTLYQMKGRIVEIAKDRDGSKFVQRRLQVADFAEMQIAFEEAVAEIEELWNDVYGNYILQGLLELGTDEMRDQIGRKIVDDGVVSLSTKVYGCRLIQKALDTLDKADVAAIVSSVKGKVWLLVHDHNGNHVIQKSVTKINELFLQSQGGGQEEEESPSDETRLLLASLDIIVDEVTDNVKDLSVHPYGCRVVQRLIENCSGPQKTKVLDAVLEEGLVGMLIDHEYGNYVVQRVLAYGRPSDRVAVYDAIATNILKLSKQKHSSNVVEMMLTYGDAGQRHRIIEEVMNCYCVDQNFVNKSAAVSMAEDAYANYVMKTVLDILEEGPTRERLFGMLVAALPDLEKSPFAKQVVLRVKAYRQESNYE